MATKFNIDGYDSYSGADIIVTAQLSNVDGNSDISKKCYVLGSLQTISISTYQDKAPVRALGNINALDYVMGPRSIAGSLVFAVFDRHFAYDIFNDLKKYTGKSVLLTDEIPALDLTLCFQNEYGKRSRMTLYGVKMVSEGQVMSVNDLFTENTYQFVGTGLENLTPEDSKYPKLNPSSPRVNPVITPTNKPFGKPDLSSGSKFDRVNKDSGTGHPDKNPSKITDIDINQPFTDKDYGEIIIGVNNPTAINAYLTNKYDSDFNELLNSDKFGNDINKWTISVPKGNYSLIYYDKITGERLGEYENLIVDSQERAKELNDYPIINYVSNSIIEAEANNPDHNQIVLTCNNSIVDRQKVQKNTCTFHNLTPSTEYKIYSNNTKNEDSISKISVCNTLDSKYQTENDFKSFVYNNKNLWINDLSNIDYDSLNIDNSLNLIDKILNMNYDYKNELLLYAIIYQNDFLKCANSENDINIIYNNDILKPYFTTKNPYKNLIFYFLKNNNFYYGDTKNTDDNTFSLKNNKNNKRYYTYAIDKDNIKSLKYDFYNYDIDEKAELDKYKKEIIDVNDYNYKNYKDQYPIMNEELLETIIYKDYNNPKYSLLEAPKVSYDFKAETLYVKLCFKELMDDDKKYYLCIRKKEDAFQNVPIVKIDIDYTMDELILNKYKTHILRNNYYLIYIEDQNNNIISESSIISSYSESQELEDFNFNNSKNYLSKIKNYLLNIYSCRDLIESVYLTTLSYDLGTKDFLDIFMQELLNEGADSLQYNNLDSIFYDSFIKKYDNMSYSIESFRYGNDQMKFDNPNLNIVTIDYYIDQEEPDKQIKNSNDIINLNNKNSYYTIIYGIDKSTKIKTGFLLKNNINNKIYTYKLNFTEVLD